MKYLYRYFIHTGKIVGLQGYNPKILTMDTVGINNEICMGEGDWKKKVPAVVYEEIKRKKLFGFASGVSKKV